MSAPTTIKHGEYRLWVSGASHDRFAELPIYNPETGHIARTILYRWDPAANVYRLVPKEELRPVPTDRPRAYRDGRWIFTDTGEPENR